jgi:hypothetical protein
VWQHARILLWKFSNKKQKKFLATSFLMLLVTAKFVINYFHIKNGCCCFRLFPKTVILFSWISRVPRIDDIPLKKVIIFATCYMCNKSRKLSDIYIVTALKAHVFNLKNRWNIPNTWKMIGISFSPDDSRVSRKNA